MKGWEGALIVVGLLLVPAFAYNNTGARTDRAVVTADSSAFLAVTNLAPTAAAPLVLRTQNSYLGNAMRATNAHTTTMSLHASLTVNPGNNFEIMNPDQTANVGVQRTFQLHYIPQKNDRICTSVVMRIEATMTSGGARVGHFFVDRTVYVQAGISC